MRYCQLLTQSVRCRTTISLRVSNFSVGLQFGVPIYRGPISLRYLTRRNVLLPITHRTCLKNVFVNCPRRSHFRVGNGALANGRITRTTIRQGILKHASDCTIRLIRRPCFIHCLRNRFRIIDEGRGHLIHLPTRLIGRLRRLCFAKGVGRDYQFVRVSSKDFLNRHLNCRRLLPFAIARHVRRTIYRVKGTCRNSKFIRRDLILFQGDSPRANMKTAPRACRFCSKRVTCVTLLHRRRAGSTQGLLINVIPGLFSFGGCISSGF